ncbi:MAG: hypothetical protein Q6370_004980 [Candidatus Sigynarchaeota archaeon]
MSKDIEYPIKAWLDSILTAWMLAFSIVIGISVGIDRNCFGIPVFLSLIAGCVVGCIICYFFADRVKNKYKLIAQLTLVNCIYFSFLLFDFWNYSIWDICLFFFLLLMNTTITLIHFCVIVYQTTTILERGRVTAWILASVVIAAPVVYFSLSVGFVKYVLYVAVFLFVAYIFLMKRHHEIYLSPRIPLKEMFNTTVIKYLIIICGLGFIEGLFLNYNSLDPSRFNIILSLIALPVILFVAFVLAGLILDLYGRRRALSSILFLLGCYAFLSSLELYVSNIGASTATYLAALILNGIAVLTIIGDISVAPSKILPILILFDVGSIIGGYLARNALISTNLTELPFIIGSFGLLIIAIILINTRDVLPEQEQHWDRALLAIYVVFNSGILLYHEEFKRDYGKKNEVVGTANEMGLAPDLISSGLVGITQLMQEIIQGKQIIRYIDNYSKKILIEAGKYIIVALIVHNDSRILREKLRKFIEEFEIEYHDDLEISAGVDMKRFESTTDLVRKYFDVKYFMGLGARKNERYPS